MRRSEQSNSLDSLPTGVPDAPPRVSGKCEITDPAKREQLVTYIAYNFMTEKGRIDWRRAFTENPAWRVALGGNRREKPPRPYLRLFASPPAQTGRARRKTARPRRQGGKREWPIRPGPSPRPGGPTRAHRPRQSDPLAASLLELRGGPRRPSRARRPLLFAMRLLPNRNRPSHQFEICPGIKALNLSRTSGNSFPSRPLAPAPPCRLAAAWDYCRATPITPARFWARWRSRTTPSSGTPGYRTRKSTTDLKKRE